MKTYYNIDVKYKAAAVLLKIYTQNHLYFNWEFFKTLHTYLLITICRFAHHYSTE